MKWQEVRLGDVCHIRGGKRLPKGHELTSETTLHPYIRARDIRNGKINFTDPKYITQKTFHKICRYVVASNDVIMTIVGANIGDIAYVSNEFDGANLTENAVKISADKSVLDSRFLKYSLLPYYVKEYLQIVASGAAQGKLGLYKVKKIPILLPHLRIQKEIVSVLSAYDDLIENNLKRIKLLEELAQITYEEWFVRMRFPGYENTQVNSETGLPEGWKEIKCYDATDILSGGTPKTTVDKYWNGDIPFYTPKDAVNCSYVFSTEKYVTELGVSKCNSKLYPKDTVFITARGTVGKVNLAGVPMAMNQSCYALRGKLNIPQYFLFFSIQSAVHSFRQASTGGVFNTIVVDTFRFLPFILPADNVMSLFNDFVSPLLAEIFNLLQQNTLLQEARDILLPRLMTGLIDVEQYDPAKLLEKEVIT